MKSIASGITLILLLAIAAPSVMAGPPEPMTSVFFDTLKKYHPEPDNVELARYYAYYPEHAGPVYAKATQQDYVFIGILYAAKAARDQSIEGVGKFDYQACMMPTKTFEAVFMKAGDFMQSYSQNPAVKAYTQAATDQAREQAAAQLASSLPYWKEIPHICHFTFNTNLEKEKQMKQTITGGASAIRGAYDAFAGGNVVQGVGSLISAGIGADVACSLADQMISGGYLGKVPVLGDLATSACSGFVGSIIKGVSAAGGAVVTTVSNFGDALAGQDKHMATQAYYDQHWRPRVAEGALRVRAGTFGSFLEDLWEPCADYFDSHTMSRSNAQETCDYHRDVVFGPAVAATIAAEDEAIRKQEEELARNRDEITREIANWRVAFLQFWTPRCFDAICDGKIKSLQEGGTSYAEAKKAKYTGGPGWPPIAVGLEQFEHMAGVELEASKVRFASINQATTQNASLAWEKLTRDQWTPRCWDKPCRTEISNLAGGMGAAARLKQLTRPEESSLAIQIEVNNEYAPKLKRTIDDSDGRRILADPNAAATDKLPRLDCQLFEGKAGNWSCGRQSSFETCVRYVKKNEAGHCRFTLGNLAYGTPDQTAEALKSSRCLPSGTRYTCASDTGKIECMKYRNGGMAVTCFGPGELVLYQQPKTVFIMPAPADTTSRGGRPAPIRTTLSPQITLVTSGNAGRVVVRTPRDNSGVVSPIIVNPQPTPAPVRQTGNGPAPVRIAPPADRKEAAGKTLVDQGCTADRAGVYTCNAERAVQLCERFKNGGLVTGCKLAAR